MELRFAQVASDYRHIGKITQPASALDLPEVYLKWYLVYPEGRSFQPDEITAAQDWLRSEITHGHLALRNEVGFVVQHRCGAVDILYVCTWRNENEAWETLFHRQRGADEGIPPGATFRRVTREDTTPTFCVWVIPAVAHEAQAWSRFLRSARDRAAQQAYCADQLHGPE